MKYLTTPFLIYALLFCMPAKLLADPGTGTGTVAETIDAGSYIYLRLEEQDMWIATTPISVSEGDQVKFSGGMEMKDFYSKALNRTFESIFFVQNVSPLGQGTEEVNGDAVTNRQHPVIPESNSIQPPTAGAIPQLVDGKTVAEIFAESSQLDGQRVSIRAKVMKVSQKIMGKNWITLQDGTGTEPENKLMTTSSELVSAGDLVIASGILKKDVDIGAGYKYKALLEEVTYTPGSN